MGNLTNDEMKEQIKNLKKQKHKLSIHQFDEFIGLIGFVLFLMISFAILGELLFGIFLEVIGMFFSIIYLTLLICYLANNLINTDYINKKNEIENKIKELKSKINNYVIENEDTINKVRGHKRIRAGVKKDEKQELLELRNHAINMENLNSKEEAKAPYTLK